MPPPIAAPEGTLVTGHKHRDRWASALSAAHLPADLDRLALVIALQARNDGTSAVASNEWLAERLGVSVSTAQRQIHKLKTLGWIDLAERGGRNGDGTKRANSYELTIPSTGHGTRTGDRLSAAVASAPDRTLSGSQQVTPQPQQVNPGASTGHGPVWPDRPPRREPPREEPPRSDQQADRPSSGDDGADDRDRVDGHLRALGHDTELLTDYCERLIEGMLAGGLHPKAVANAVAARIKAGTDDWPERATGALSDGTAEDPTWAQLARHSIANARRDRHSRSAS